MPNLEYDFNNDDYQLIASDETNVQLSNNDYVRISLYTINEGNQISNEIYQYSVTVADTEIVTQKAVFYSSLSEIPFDINESAFFTGTEPKIRLVGSSYNDFKLYQRDDNGSKKYFLKPNELFNDKELPEGKYNIKIDFLQQLNPNNITTEYLETLPQPQYIQEVDIDGDGDLTVLDAVEWPDVGRPDIAYYISQQVSGVTNYYTDYTPTGDEDPNQGPLDSDAYHNPGFVGNTYDFIIKQISTSRKEVRLKLLNHDLQRNTDGSFNYPYNDILNQLTQNNPTTGYKFNHLLNVGDGNHIPITNFEFDGVTDGKENQSIILRLYEPIPLFVNNQKLVSIESEKLITQTTEIYYFSDVEPQVIGLGLTPDNLENWINPNQTENLEFQNYDELTSSLSDISLNQYVSGSSHYYPNLNIDYNEFSNHTFFGSAKRKLENFETKIKTIQGHYSKISSSLNVSSSMEGDSTDVIQLRKDLFNKINEEINAFTPYERFLYYDGQSESTASAPSLINYADTIPVQTGINKDYIGQINGGDGFDVVYHHSSKDTGGASSGQFIDLFTNKYYVHNKPFFNYSSSIYLSFLMKADSGSALTFDNRQENYPNDGGDVSFPRDSKFKENVLNPQMTSSAYQRYIFHTSHSYFIPTAKVDNDFSRINDFKAGSSEIEILSGSFKTGSTFVRDSSGKYQNYSTVVTGSGVKFKGSVMPAGELFRIFYKNNLSSSLQGYWNIDDVESGSALTIANVTNDAGPTTGDAISISGSTPPHESQNDPVTAAGGVQIHNRTYGSSYFMISESKQKVVFDTTDFNFGKDDDFSMAIWVKRFHPNVVNANSSDNGVQSIFTRGHTNHTYGIDYNQDNSSLRAGVRGSDADGGSTHIVQTTCDLSSSWNHVAFTYESGSDAGIKLYLNGQLAASKTTIAPYNITGSNDFSLSSISKEPEFLSLGGADQLGGGTGTIPNRWFNGFLQYPRIYNRTISADEVQQLYLLPDGISDSNITDVKVTLKNPKNALPFDNLFHTSSAEWTNWYNDLLTKAETFDTNNIHSLENNLPLYIQESSEYGDLKDFLSLQGEQYDVIKNHIDGLNTIHDRGYNESNSPPENIYPMLLDNLGYQAINPFSGSLTDSLGSYLSGVTSIDDIKNNTWRKTLNNIIYIYKSKGTKNSIRGLLNVYGYPPDVLSVKEFGTGYETSNDNQSPFNNQIPTSGQVDLDLEAQGNSIQFQSSDNRLFYYMFQNNPLRTFNLDWYMNDANINTIEFVYKHNSTTNTQTILESSGSGNQKLWDLRLIPSADGISSSFEFRLNNSNTGSGAIASNAISMSTSYSKILDGQIWNLMLQRMTSSISGSGTNEYRLHAALQDDKKITTYNYVTMSVSGGLSNSYITGAADNNYYANQNFVLTGSRASTNFSNLVVGRTLSGSLAQIKAWNSPLSTSRFRQHTINKTSVVGNTINSHKDELIYYFKLSENYSTSSISSSTQLVSFVDAASKTTLPTNYTFQKTGSFLTSSVAYGVDIIKQIKIGLADNNENIVNDNKININPSYKVIGNLNSKTPSIIKTEKGVNNVSNKLELDKSMTNIIDGHILDRTDTFEFDKFYGNPMNFYSSSYTELDNLRHNFFKSFPIQVNINEFIRANENIFNHSLSEGIKTLVPAHSTLSDSRSGFGITVKQNLLERNKYSHKQHSVEINPNLASGSLNFVENTEYKQQSFTANLELPYSSSISLGNAYSASKGYIHSPFLQPSGVTGSIEFPKSGSSILVNNFILLNTTTIDFPKSGSIDMGNNYQTGSNQVPNFLRKGGITGSVVFPYSSSINFISTHFNKSFENIHDSWGTSSNDTHFINFAGGTGSEANYNVGHIDTRVVFHMIGDTEFYSASFGNATDFGNSERFDNRLQITENVPSSVQYDSKNFATGSGIFNGRMMGKTRYFFTNTDGTIESLPINHVTRFSNPFTTQMIKGTQNTNPGFFPKSSPTEKDVDFSTASFYSISVTGGENQIIIKDDGNPIIGSDGSITYG
tara:strand:- start:16 stop:6027 length:6012 start_codon:yes stop_codon:yes gene_type:complete